MKEGFALHEIICNDAGEPVDYRFLDVNKSFENMTNLKKEKLIGKTVLEVLPQTEKYWIEKYGEVALTQESINFENYSKAIGKTFSVNAFSPQKGIFAVIFFDVTEHRKKTNDILYLSYHDVLTGLKNRRFFEDEIKRAGQEPLLPISIIMGDVNGLKLVNDVFGHFEGDRLLCSAAQIMEEVCRPKDITARWGGDEFIILLSNTTEEETGAICKEIKKRCNNKDEATIKTSISLGYATKEKMDQDLTEVIKKAEDFMYKHKLLESRSVRSVVINSIKSTLYEKSHETEEHAERLKDLCRQTGVYMGLSDIELYELELLAVLHDIGKIAIKDSVLNKPGKLTEEEWAEMKRHPEIGYRIIQSTPELAQIAEYILTHHERWDGKGYPSELKGESIPLLSRILAVTDAYDAMTNERPYRRPITKYEAIKELERYAGTQFDPIVVEKFIEKVL